MRITLNGLELQRRAQGSQTLAQVIAELQEEVKRGGKIVTRIVVDGEPLPDDWRRRNVLSSVVSAVEHLELAIDEPSRLTRQTLADTKRLLEKIIADSKPLALKMRIGDEITGNNDLADYLDNLKLAVEGMDVCTRSTQREEVAPLRHRVVEAADRLLPTLNRIYQAQATADYIAIADELEYELPTQMEGWQGLLTEALHVLESPARTS